MKRICALALAALLSSCGDGADVAPATGFATLPQEPYRTLAEWRLFRDPVAQTPADNVLPYTVNAPLFSDFTAKFRFVAIPPGRHITYRPDGPWVLPEGAVLVKTFSYPRDARNLSPFPCASLMLTPPSFSFFAQTGPFS